MLKQFALVAASLIVVPFEVAAQDCNPQFPATCVVAPQFPQYFPPPTDYGITTFTDQYGQVLGRAETYAGTTTFTDQYGATLGRAQGFGTGTIYTDQFGNTLGYGN